MIPFPDKKYQIIYADPPWSYRGKMMNSSVTDHYSTMTLLDICNLPVKIISDDNCILFLWVTLPKLNEFMNVVINWGFEYKTTAFVWVKTNKRTDINQFSFLPKDSIDSFMGLGRWTRANAEICILATRGQVERKSKSIEQLQLLPLEGHSKKPDHFRNLIIELIGDLPRIELFAREKTEGWDVWGNEV